MQSGEVPRDWFERVSRMLLFFESQGVMAGGDTQSVSKLVMPVILTSGWTKDDGGMYKASATRLIAMDGAGRYDDNSGVYGTVDVYSPTDGRGESQPSTAQGDLVFVVFRGRWEILGGSPRGEFNVYQGAPLANMTSGTGYGHLVNRTRVLTTSSNTPSIIEGRRDVVVVLNDWNNARIYRDTPVTYTDNNGSLVTQNSTSLNGSIGKDYKILLSTDYNSPFPLLRLIGDNTASVSTISDYGAASYNIFCKNATSSDIPIDQRYTWYFRLATTRADSVMNTISSNTTCNIPDVIYVYAQGSGGKMNIGQLYNPLGTRSVMYGNMLQNATLGSSYASEAVDVSQYISNNQLRMPLIRNSVPNISNEAFHDLFEIGYTLSEYTDINTMIAGNDAQMRLDIPLDSIANKQLFTIILKIKSKTLGRVTFQQGQGYYKIS